MDKAGLLRLYNLELDKLLKISSEFIKNDVEFCSLINARSGKCSQNCKYCAQSSYYRTHIESYPLVDIEKVRTSALEAKSHKASRFAIVTSGKTPDESDFDKILEMIDEATTQAATLRKEREDWSMGETLRLVPERPGTAEDRINLHFPHFSVFTCVCEEQSRYLGTVPCGRRGGPLPHHPFFLRGFP